MWIEPKGFETTHLRGNTEAHRLQDPAKWVPFGVGAIEGKAGASLRVLEPGAANGANGASGTSGAEDQLNGQERAATDTSAGIVEAGDLASEEQLERARPPYGPGEEPRP